MREADQIDSFLVGLGAGVITVMVILTVAKMYG
jgi:hypothetical protein